MKAKDLRGKNIEDIEEVNKTDEPAQEEDAVAAAYENISKRLESLRGDKSSEEDEKEESSVEEEKEEIELQEWKGPRKPTKEDFVEVEEESDTHELRKVKLKNLETNKEDEDEIDPLDDEEEDDEAVVKKTASKEWQPEENDPLDEEESESLKDKDNPPASEVREKEENYDEVLESRIEAKSKGEPDEDEEESEDRERTRGDMLVADDSGTSSKEETAIADELDMSADVDRHEGEMPKRESKEEVEENFSESREPDSLDDLAKENPRTISQMAAEDDYFIPNLKGSRQREVDMSYNAHPQTGSVGDSYAPRQNNMDSNDPNSFFSQHQPQPPKRANKFHLLILVVIGIAVIGFTVYILKGGFGDINLGSAPSPSPSMTAEVTPEPTPTPTPAPEVDRGEFTIRVLNGTTTSGLARTVSDDLEELGYETTNPGNASANDVEQTEIRVKEGSESAALFEALKADLAPDYEAIAGDDLSKSASYDAEVIIGAK